MFRITTLVVLLAANLSFAGVTFDPTTGIGSLPKEYVAQFGSSLPAVTWQHTDEVVYEVVYNGPTSSGTAIISTYVTTTLSSSASVTGVSLTGHSGAPTTLFKVPAVGDTFRNQDGTISTITSVSPASLRFTTIHGVLNGKFNTIYTTRPPVQ